MNSFGQTFRLTTFGESHGPAIGGIIDGCPANMALDFNEVGNELARRSPAGKTGTSPRREPDEVEWLSGLTLTPDRGPVTLGTPIAFLIRNRDTRSHDYDALKDLFRPGHGDYTWQQKYGIRDPRGGGRCSARETAARVVAGAIAKQILREKGIAISSSTECESPDDGNTHGGIVRCTATGLPVGVGSPLFDRLQSQLAAAMMSIPSATGFEVGEGFRAATMTGREYMDRWNPDFSTQTNHCGGIMGGLSNGMPVTFRVAFHPVVTQPHNLPCVDAEGNEHILDKVDGRHDLCHVPRAAAVVEAMAAIVLVDAML